MHYSAAWPWANHIGSQTLNIGAHSREWAKDVAVRYSTESALWGRFVSLKIQMSVRIHNKDFLSPPHSPLQKQPTSSDTFNVSWLAYSYTRHIVFPSLAQMDILSLLFCLFFFTLNSIKQEINPYFNKKNLTILYSYIVFHCRDFHNVFQYGPIDGHLDYFQPFAIACNAVINNSLDNLFHRCVDYI